MASLHIVIRSMRFFATYDISGHSVRFTPLSAWFYAIGLMPLEFNTGGESLVLLGNETVEIYNILSGGRSLRIRLNNLLE